MKTYKLGKQVSFGTAKYAEGGVVQRTDDSVRRDRVQADQDQLENDRSTAFPGIAGSNHLGKDFRAIWDKDARTENKIDESAGTGRLVAQRRDRMNMQNNDENEKTFAKIRRERMGNKDK